MTNDSFTQTEIQELKSKNYLEVTIMNVCKTIAIFARFDTRYSIVVM